ncbi:hypothetical protein AGR7A_pTi0122 [Agrobacterium deltaense NCPPB 1641]|uniref:Uncharacterized protein n=1 Tax=Agrobacterium deltaense NCPPB 1641 TaxID=1183425 RepID=A0A1S7UC45_9HYPH|nr:hypothetical protein AGR7A_pTi0122 [Agrobacterium deltaense NCPPB 1641]
MEAMNFSAKRYSAVMQRRGRGKNSPLMDGDDIPKGVSSPVKQQNPRRGLDRDLLGKLRNAVSDISSVRSLSIEIRRQGY